MREWETGRPHPQGAHCLGWRQTLNPCLGCSEGEKGGRIQVLESRIPQMVLYSDEETGAQENLVFL